MREPTRYDDPAQASDGHGGMHPLAGVPQEALDAALTALKNATIVLPNQNGETLTVLDVQEDDEEDLRGIAEAILTAALQASEAKTGEHPYQRRGTIPAAPNQDPDEL